MATRATGAPSSLPADQPRTTSGWPTWSDVSPAELPALSIQPNGAPDAVSRPPLQAASARSTREQFIICEYFVSIDANLGIWSVEINNANVADFLRADSRV